MGDERTKARCNMKLGVFFFFFSQDSSKGGGKRRNKRKYVNESQWQRGLR